MSKYTYRIKWSHDDNEYVATCDEFPSLSWLDKSAVAAVKGIKQVVSNVLDAKEASGMIGFAPQPKEHVAQLESALRGLLGWAYGGGCSDCSPFRAAPSCIEFQHARDCGYLESVNAALLLLGREPEEGHDYADPEAEMIRLAEERTTDCRKQGIIK